MDILLKKFRDCLESEFADDFLEILLQGMALAFRFPGLNENIRGFDARYVFTSPDRSIHATAIFEHNRMEVKDTAITSPAPNLTIMFQSSKALMHLLLGGNPDILGSILHQEVRLDGNLNYLYKFAYMARHLQLMATKGV